MKSFHRIALPGLFGAVVLLAMLFAAPSRAELVIEITEGIDDPTAIAVVPFSTQGGGVPTEDIAAVIDSDLARSGQFAPIRRSDMLSRPSSEQELFYRDWRAISAEYIVLGRVSSITTMRIEYELYDVTRQASVHSGVVSGDPSEARMLAHRVADEIYEKLTGIPGAFATRLLYVSVTRVPGGKDYARLTLADSDGARPIVLLESREPILAPAWSPDGAEIAYVSFESGRPAIYRQELATGRREQLTNFKGINGSPAWSPDGNTMAMVLSKDGSPDIYLMDLASKRLKRITSHYAIDTEPTWMPDGNSLLFTSDRGGKPQIYQVELATNFLERLTFRGDYNARARLLPDGKHLVFVHRNNGVFHIAWQDLERDNLQVLTKTALDESPSLAPNGAMLIYATQHQGRGILAVVSIDGRVKYRLPSSSGDVREPAWSPYLGG